MGRRVTIAVGIFVVIFMILWGLCDIVFGGSAWQIIYYGSEGMMKL